MKSIRKKWHLAFVTVPVILIVALYASGFGKSVFCSSYMVLNEAPHKASIGEFRSYIHSRYKLFQDIARNETRTTKERHRHSPLTTHWSREPSVNMAKSPLEFDTDEMSTEVKSTDDADILPSTAETQKLVTNSYDILSNVSFPNVVTVTEDANFDSTEFHNWTMTHLLFHHRYSFKMPDWVERGDHLCDNDTQMVIIMPAEPSHGLRREVIRQTWASSIYGMHFPRVRTSFLKTKIAFIIGTSGLGKSKREVILREAATYNDIVAADFVDSYRNLSLKMMVGLNWASRYCRSVKYVMKADLDTFVNIPLLNTFLLEISKTLPNYILGHRHSWAKPPVLRTGIWQVDREEYPFDSFPPYLYGHSYVMTSQLVPLIVSTGKHLPLIPNEDAFITGIVAFIIGAQRLHYDGFAHAFNKIISCRVVYNQDITVTKMSTSQLIQMWRDLSTTVCSNENLPSNADDK